MIRVQLSLALFLLTLLGLGCASLSSQQAADSPEPDVAEPSPSLPEWKQRVDAEVKKLGYGNWIVIGDAAYPHREHATTHTINVGAETPEIVDLVINSIDQTQHVKPVFYLPSELRALQEQQAPGISAYRSELVGALHGYRPLELNEQMLNTLVAETAKTFTVLVIKGETTLPYSSVFIDLDSGYWDKEHEQSLRQSIQASATPQ